MEPALHQSIWKIVNRRRLTYHKNNNLSLTHSWDVLQLGCYSFTFHIGRAKPVEVAEEILMRELVVIIQKGSTVNQSVFLCFTSFDDETLVVDSLWMNA